MAFKTYRAKRPFDVRAMQWTGRLEDFPMEASGYAFVRQRYEDDLHDLIVYAGGLQAVCIPGAWIVELADGVYVVVSEERFHSLYEPCDETTGTQNDSLPVVP